MTSHDEQVAVDTVLAGLEAGIDLIDTSAAYLGGASERYIGIALQEWYRRGHRREELIIESKAGSRRRPHDYSYDAIMASTELSLRALQTDYLDLMLVHDPAEIEPVLAPHAARDALLALKEQGVVRHVGLGCRPHAHHRACIASGDFDVSLTFADYNLIERSALAGVLEPAVAADVGVFNAAIMLSGALGGEDPVAVAARAAGVAPERVEMTPRLRRARWMYDWCAARGLDLHVLNLHFCLRETRFASILIGFSTPARVAQNVAAYRQRIDPARWEEAGARLGRRRSHRLRRTMKREKLRVAVVGGCGDWGRRYTYAYANHPEAELIALADTARDRRQRFAEHYGIPHQFDTVQELLAWQVPEVVANILPVSAAPAAVIACAEAGRQGHLLREAGRGAAGRCRCDGGDLRAARRGVRLRHRALGGAQHRQDRRVGTRGCHRPAHRVRPPTATWHTATRSRAWAASSSTISASSPATRVDWVEGWTVPEEAAAGDDDCAAYGVLGMPGGYVCTAAREMPATGAYQLALFGEQGAVYLAGAAGTVLLQGSGSRARPVRPAFLDEPTADERAGGPFLGRGRQPHGRGARRAPGAVQRT